MTNDYILTQTDILEVSILNEITIVFFFILDGTM